MNQKKQKGKLNDYEIIRDLGTGSYGKVQLIRRKQDKKYYALKSVFLANAKQKQKDGALNQIRLLASINMPSVISYKSSFYVPQTQSLCIIMEFADGGDLQGKLNKRIQLFETVGFDQKFIWKTAYEILKGLKCLHQNKIIHRDLKSANIFFVNGVAKIGDLNISKITDNGFASTQTGTPYYTAPEIWNGQKYDYKCDIWALGCIIYELCTLMPPFTAKDFPGLFLSITRGVYEEISSQYSAQLRAFIKQCLKVKIQQRPSAATLLQKDQFLQLEWDHPQPQINSAVNILEPIQCPKVLKFLNQKLPRSKFQENGKKTVCFVGKEDSQNSVNFKIKKVIRSEKIIIDPQSKKSTKQIKISPVQHISRPMKSAKKLPPLQKQLPKFTKIRPQSKSKNTCRSMKNILQKENSKVTII